MPSFPIWLLLLFAAAAAGTWLARHYAVRGNLIDQPGERRSHTVATPRGGGIAIVGVLLAAGAWLLWQEQAAGWLLPAFLAGLLLVAGIGWWDDHRPLSPWSRLAVQSMAAAMLALGAWHDSGEVLLGLFAFVAALVLVNVWNFMDGINGLAASQAALAALAYTWALRGGWSWLAGALFAGCAGFLPFNFPRARIFLGDVGSGALGLALAALWVAGWDAARIPWPWLALPLCVFLIDAGFTLAARMLSGQRWWSPHVTHVYQIAARRFGHAKVTLAYGLASAVAILLIICSHAHGSMWHALGATAAWYIGAAVLWGLMRRGWHEK